MCVTFVIVLNVIAIVRERVELGELKHLSVVEFHGKISVKMGKHWQRWIGYFRSVSCSDSKERFCVFEVNERVKK